ncbi:arginyl-tRNA synthetase(arginine--tRNA ligase) (ARGRS) [Streptococcus pneumoniae]|nr:arginyl-tRNA synthetase(arginine--tRNA ligase) (ARGRS) [Streptococcus pneumoniae]
MNTKELIASELSSIIDSLDQEAILKLLETPKNSEMGDIAFPAFSLAKVERKAPQMIAAELAEKMNSQAFEKVSLINLPFLLKYCKLLPLKKNTMLTKILANKKMLLSTCLVRISLNHFLLATCVQLLSEIACHIFSKKSVIKRSRSTIWETGVNNLGC